MDNFVEWIICPYFVIKVALITSILMLYQFQSGYCIAYDLTVDNLSTNLQLRLIPGCNWGTKPNLMGKKKFLTELSIFCRQCK